MKNDHKTNNNLKIICKMKRRNVKNGIKWSLVIDIFFILLCYAHMRANRRDDLKKMQKMDQNTKPKPNSIRDDRKANVTKE